MAIPPSIFPTVIERLGEAGLHANERGWTRLIVEKPFGRDLESARELNPEKEIDIGRVTQQLEDEGADKFAASELTREDEKT